MRVEDQKASPKCVDRMRWRGTLACRQAFDLIRVHSWPSAVFGSLDPENHHRAPQMNLVAILQLEPASVAVDLLALPRPDNPDIAGIPFLAVVEPVIKDTVVAGCRIAADVGMLAGNRSSDLVLLNKRQMVAPREPLVAVNVESAADIGARLVERDLSRR